MIENWVEKYRPKKFREVGGQDFVIEKIKKFLKTFSNADDANKVLVLHGPSGTGKTSLVYAAANEFNGEIFELNASDFRNEEKLNSILRPATEQASLTKNIKIILVDEIDGISDEDERGVSKLIEIMESTQHPMFLTSNDIWSKKFSEVRKRAELIQLKEIDYKTTKEILISILKKEKKFLHNDILTNITIKSKGDLRAAINDLQIAASLKEPSAFLIDERNKEIDIFTALRIVLKGKPDNSFLRIFDSVNKPLDEIILWIEENLPLEYREDELAKAYDVLSKIDIYKKRVNRQQHWRFLVYQNDLLSYGISSAKKGEKTGFTVYKKPTRILKIWLNNQRTERKKSITKKYAEYVHVSEKKAIQEFPLIKKFLLNPKIQKELKLSDDEIEYINEN